MDGHAELVVTIDHGLPAGWQLPVHVTAWLLCAHRIMHGLCLHKKMQRLCMVCLRKYPLVLQSWFVPVQLRYTRL